MKQLVITVQGAYHRALRRQTAANQANLVNLAMNSLVAQLFTLQSRSDQVLHPNFVFPEGRFHQYSLK
jgi:hypothetical protein